MSYADSLMATDERIVHREKQHVLVLVWSSRYAILAMILAVLFLVLGNNIAQDGTAGTFRTILGWVTAALFVGGLLMFLWAVLEYLNHEYVLSTRRVLQVFGVLNKTSMDSSLEKINDATLTQSVFGRIFGYGDLDILTAADTGIDRFRMIRDPVGFKRAMLDAKHEYERDMSGADRYAPSPPLRTEVQEMVTPAPVAAPTPPERAPEAAASAPGRLTADELTRTLSSLADLRDRGAISADEYERKKADLLGRL